MRPARTRVGRLVPALGCLLLGVSSGPLLAQERTTADTISWGSVGTRAGWCVEFLMEPKAAAEDLTRGYRVSAARESRTLLPAIARLISEEPTYADWVPSQLCLYLADGITLQNRRYDRGDAGQPIAFRSRIPEKWNECSQAPYKGAKSYNLRGHVVDLATFHGALCAVDPAAQRLITFGEKQIPIAYDLADDALQRDLGPMPKTPLVEGIRATYEHFRRLQAEGRLDTSDLG